MDGKYLNLYDSHVHFLGTAEYLGGVALTDVRSADQLKDLVFKPTAYKGDFLTAFGWNPKNIPKEELTADILDRVFPDVPVMFSRNDGHASWLNTLALKRLGFGDRQGLLEEADHFLALERLPKRDHEALKNKLMEASQIFLSQGFTHLRDLTSSKEEALALFELSKEGRFQQFIELNFLLKNIRDLGPLLETLRDLKARAVPNVCIQGVKLFFDGTLGGGNAFVQQCQCCRDSQYWTRELYSEVLKQVWGAGFDIAVHCIGDDAVDEIVSWTREVSAQGIVGRLHLEHAEFVRSETIQKMKPLHVKVHMQPCHWFGDKEWLATKASSALKKIAFPWESLRRAQIPIHFGSDSPVVAPSVISNYQALQQSAHDGIKKFEGDFAQFHSYSGGTSIEAETIFEDQEVRSVRINGQIVWHKD